MTFLVPLWCVVAPPLSRLTTVNYLMNITASNGTSNNGPPDGKGTPRRLARDGGQFYAQNMLPSVILPSDRTTHLILSPGCRKCGPIAAAVFVSLNYAANEALFGDRWGHITCDLPHFEVLNFLRG